MSRKRSGGFSAGGGVLVTHRSDAPAKASTAVAAIRSDADRLATYESIIGEAAATMREAHSRFVLDAGSALASIRDEGLYRLTHGTFEAYVIEQWGWSRPYAYQLMASVPVVAALSARADTADLRPGHVKVLAPIIAQRGEQAGRDVWDAAVQAGGATVEGLRTARRALENPPPDDVIIDAEIVETETVTTPSDTAFAQLDRALIELRAARRRLSHGTLALAAASDPDRYAEMRDVLVDVVGRMDRTLGRVPRPVTSGTDVEGAAAPK